MIYLILIILGLCFGSFITALTWRLYEQSKLKVKSAKLSILKGRSMCESCGHTLMPLDLVPVFSWVSLKGKCRYCHTKVGIENPLIELTTALLFVLSYIYWPNGFDIEGKILFVIWLSMLVCLVALAIYDLRWRLLPNQIVFTFIYLVVAQVLIKFIFFHAGVNFIFGSIMGLLISAGFFYIIFKVSNGKWIGGGDIKLTIGLGLLIGGPSETVLMLFGASVFGTIISIPLLLRKKLRVNSKIPFGPMLIASTMVCYFFGTNIVQWYSTIFIK